jgi:hypothetical protein
MRPERWIVVFGLLAGLLAAAMAVLAFSSGVTQEYFEFVHPLPEYAEKLKQQGTQLRIAFSLDNLFLLAYSGFFLFFAIERRGKADPLAINVMIGSLLFAALLDAVENFHILALLNSAETGRFPAGDGEIELQYILSAVKFTAGYFVAVIFGILYPRDTILARVVGASTAIVFPILGVLVFTTPAPWSDLCGLGRVVCFVVGVFVSAIG